MKYQEVFDIVDQNDIVIGQRSRRECHGNPVFIHRVSHVLLFNSEGQLLLQKRSLTKDVQPGRWDTSVGGHLDQGETYLAAAQREMEEELAVRGVSLHFLYPSQLRNDFESENVMTYLAVYDGTVCKNPDEIDDVRFWTEAEICEKLGRDFFTPNFEQEWALWKAWRLKNPEFSFKSVAG